MPAIVVFGNIARTFVEIKMRRQDLPEGGAGECKYSYQNDKHCRFVLAAHEGSSFFLSV